MGFEINSRSKKLWESDIYTKICSNFPNFKFNFDKKFTHHISTADRILTEQQLRELIATPKKKKKRKGKRGGKKKRGGKGRMRAVD